MSDQLTETAAEIAALIPQYSWQIMDEEQRDDLMQKVVLPRYMKTTADGVQTGPTFWSEMVGASAKAIESRVYRLRQSQTSSVPEPARAVDPRSVRHAKSVLRKDPSVIGEMVEELHDEPAFRAALASASSRIEDKDEQTRVERHSVQSGHDPQERAYEKFKSEIRRGNYGNAERLLDSFEIDEERGGYLRKEAERHRNLASWFDALADAKPISDEQLAEWLA